MTEPKARAKTRYEIAGVPSEYLNSDNGKFLVGHDAKLKSRLISDALAAEADKKRTSDAHKLLAKLGWTSHLDKSREARKAKAEAVADRAAAKAAKPKATAAESE